MSWNIYVYAEVKHGGSDKYVELINRSLFDDYKSYSDDFYDELPQMAASNTSISTVNSLEGPMPGLDVNVRYCSLDDFFAHYSHIVDISKEKIKIIYKALGLNLVDEDDELYCSHCYEDDEFSKDRMTLPVNKDLMCDFVTILNELNKATAMLGFCKVVGSMCQYDDKVRLVFVVL